MATSSHSVFHQTDAHEQLVMWQGFYSSLRPGINRVFLNVDITSAPMYTAGSLPNLMRAFGTQMQRGRPGPPPDIAAAKMQPRLQVALARFVFRSYSQFRG